MRAFVAQSPGDETHALYGRRDVRRYKVYRFFTDLMGGRHGKIKFPGFD